MTILSQNSRWDSVAVFWAIFTYLNTQVVVIIINHIPAILLIVTFVPLKNTFNETCILVALIFKCFRYKEMGRIFCLFKKPNCVELRHRFSVLFSCIWWTIGTRWQNALITSKRYSQRNEMATSMFLAKMFVCMVFLIISV